MTSPFTKQDLQQLEPEASFFIGVDSDGCVFDSMELKHKECFCPAFINHYGLQGVSGFARETWEFVNLYSKTRGANRFVAVVEALNLLNQRPQVLQQLGGPIDTGELEAWIANETRLSGPVLDQFLQEKGDAIAPDSILRASLAWSNDVMEAVKRIVHDLPPIAEAVQALEKIQGQADCVVVSQTPSADLVREWREHDIDRFTRMIAGQEQGTKTEHLALAAGSKYQQGRVLMVGDAPGDHRSAKDNGFLFFPIVPGRERDSWAELRDHGLDRFFQGTYAGDYETSRMQEFEDSLPERPPWAS
jgi:phosphoglycolate phosphatase-like HAD superfamily hydrolase